MKDIELIHGDCIEEMQKLIEKKVKVDMVLTDPPYGTTNCKWDNVISFNPMWDCIKGIVKDNSAIALFGSEPFSSNLRMSNINMFKYDWIWEKSKASNFLQASYMPLKSHEIVSIFCKVGKTTYIPQKTEGKPFNKGKRKNNNGVAALVYNKIPNVDKFDMENKTGMRNPRSVQYFKTAESEGKCMHPTQKPVALLEYLIKTYTNEGDTVLDFTMGSGSTAIACINTNRKFIGIELDEKYFDIAKDRVENNIK